MNGPITIAMPVSLRKKVGADSKSGNQVGLVLAESSNLKRGVRRRKHELIYI